MNSRVIHPLARVAADAHDGGSTSVRMTPDDMFERRGPAELHSVTDRDAPAPTDAGRDRSEPNRPTARGNDDIRIHVVSETRRGARSCDALPEERTIALE